ncbi:hypothetical protein HRR86_006152 [Exophiala dermatitidis]|nr:hypothetical protein HRR77_005750 [Exophiala dermatitidis]KAJ4548241.1 hypothetical protein HRR76_000848 [Exophiala dermatitidis]KAJ4570227.1 hypothetical protein HRR82_007436 [Exophiala dermatitidis]KAJ4578510.1 hypothetical protein HRR79_001810 [Exophiala dermatitidis]KAJ4611252.1 hypothetical protein HRR85_005081 [Exophiala dermatitidis]
MMETSSGDGNMMDTRGNATTYGNGKGNADVDVDIEMKGESDAESQAQTQVQTLLLDRIDAVLDYIRSNLANILRTWGRESPQYRDAKEMMQAYLVENMERLKSATAAVADGSVSTPGTSRTRPVAGNGDVETKEMKEESLQKPGQRERKRERLKEIEDGIETLMRELRL